MLKRGFIKLLKRYRDGTLPGHVADAMNMWYQSIRKTPVESHEREAIKKRIWSGIQEGRELTGNERKERVTYWKSVGRWVGAATVLLVLGVAYYLTEVPSSSQEIVLGGETPGSDWIEEVGEDKREVVLPDGSRVVLEPGSGLRYRKEFNDGNRTVFLEGSGFFDVTKDSERPFLVYSGAVVTRVLGTSFTIKTIEGTGGTEVAVVTGKVIVEKNKYRDLKPDRADHDSRIVLTPNKKVTFFDSSDLYVTGLVENPVVVARQEEYLKPGAFVFDETPLMEVLGKLEKAYGLEIAVSSDDMLECPVTADLSSESLYGKMEIISAVLNTQYEITGSSILLAGGGCSPAKSDSKQH